MRKAGKSSRTSCSQAVGRKEYTLKSLGGPGASMEGRADFGGSCSMDEDILRKLKERLGPLHARQRLGIETDHEAQIFGQGLLSFHIVNWYPVHSVIRNALKLTGLYWRGRRNTGSILVKRNDVMFKELPPLFDGFTILHLSDMQDRKSTRLNSSHLGISYAV